MMKNDLIVKFFILIDINSIKYFLYLIINNLVKLQIEILVKGTLLSTLNLVNIDKSFKNTLD